VSSTSAVLVPGPIFDLDDYPTDIAWSPDSNALIIAGGEGRLIRAHCDGSPPVLMGVQGSGLLSVRWQPGGALVATAGQDGAVCLWDAKTSETPARMIHRGPRWPLGLCFRADGQRLAFAVNKEVLIHDMVATGTTIAAGVMDKPALVLGGHSVPLTHLAWRGRDELIAVGNGALFVDRTDAGGKVTQFVLEGTPLNLALSSDLKIVANGLADGSVNFRFLNNQKRSRMSGYEGKVDQTAWSANSRYLATSSTGASAIAIWDFSGKGPEGSDPLQLEAHAERIDCLAWQPGGTHLVSAGRDWRVVLWRPGAAMRKALDIQLLDGPAGIASWSPDGKRLAIAQPSGKLRLYTLA
jgi:WD40 repeat protein